LVLTLNPLTLNYILKSIAKLDTSFVLLLFQAIESLVESHIIPFNGGDLIVLHPSKGIDEMSAQVRVNVFGLEAPQAWPVLGPVAEIAYQLVGRA
jgi:hypothetical protein